MKLKRIAGAVKRPFGRCLRSVLIALLVTAGLHLPDRGARATAAPVTFAYGERFDRTCALLRGRAVDAAWRVELERRLPELEAAWLEEARPVLVRALQIAGERPSDDPTVRLTLCDLPSSSWLGPVVNMRHALAGYTDRPVPLRYKALTAAHELLHPVVAGRDLAGSPMLAAHAEESHRVRDHLHLFALMKAAMLELGREDLLAELRRLDGDLPHPAYRRAWAIVDATPEAHLAFVKEVQEAR